MSKIDECYALIEALNTSEEQEVFEPADPEISIRKSDGKYVGGVTFSNRTSSAEGDTISTFREVSTFDGNWVQQHCDTFEEAIDVIHSKLLEATKKRTERMRGVIDSLAKFIAGR